MRISFSAGRPSRLKKPPGNLAGGERLLLVVTGEREEIDSFARAVERRRGDQHDGFPKPDEGGATRLLRHPARLDDERTAVEIDLDLLMAGL